MRLGDPAEIGRLVREKRKALGLTLEQMAAQTGLSFITLLRLEKGRTGYIHNKTAKALESLELSRKTLKQRKFIVTQPPPLGPKPVVVQESGDKLRTDKPNLRLKFWMGLRSKIDKIIEAK